MLAATGRRCLNKPTARRQDGFAGRLRYEKLERSFVALNHIAAAIIAFRKVPLKVNIIYG